MEKRIVIDLSGIEALMRDFWASFLWCESN